MESLQSYKSLSSDSSKIEWFLQTLIEKRCITQEDLGWEVTEEDDNNDQGEPIAREEIHSTRKRDDSSKKDSTAATKKKEWRKNIPIRIED